MAVTVLHAQTIGFGKSEILQAPGPHQGVDPVEFTLRFDAELATDPEFQSPEQAIETTVPPAAETTQRPRTSQPLNAGPGNPTPDSSEIPLPNGRPIPVDRQTFPVPIPSEFATDRTANLG